MNVRSILFLGLLLLFSCSDSDNGSQDDPMEEPTPRLSSLVITSSNGNTLDVNGDDSTTLSATGRDQFDDPITLPSAVVWSSNNGNATVDQSGNVMAVAAGSDVITATSGTVSANFNLSIIDSTPLQGTFIYVSDAAGFDTGPWKIIRYDENGNNPVDFITSGLAWPQDILFLEDRNEVLISNLNTGNINRHNADTGALIGMFANVSGGPTRIKIGPDNLLYVLQWGGNGNVLRYNLDGSFVDEFTSTGVFRSIGMDWDSNNNLYVSSFQEASIRKFDENGNDLGIFVNSNLAGPTDLWFDTDGNLLANDWSGNRVVRFDADGNFMDNFISSGLIQPEGVDFFEDGSFIIGSGGTSEVKQYAADGSTLGNLVSSGTGGLMQPNAVRIRVIE